jgi:putative ABC transport system permease protein
MSGWIGDLDYSVRRLLRAPAFTLTSIGLLALSMSVTIGLFVIVYDAFYRPLPYPDPDRMVYLGIHLIRENLEGRIDAAHMAGFDHHPEIFSQYGGFSQNLEFLQNGPGSEPTQLQVVYLQPEVFSLLQMHPLVGRLPDITDAMARSPPRVLVTEHFAVERFGSAAAALGHMLPLRTGQYQIIGVLPEQPLTRQTVLWIPTMFTPEQLAASAGLGYTGVAVIGRLARGVTPAEASRRLTAITDGDPQVVDSPFWHDVQVIAAPIRSLWTFPYERLLLLSVFGAAVMLWLITVSNVCNLYIARLAGRQHESALISALGATPGRVFRLHAQDCLLIAAAALALALALVPLELLAVHLYEMFYGGSPYPLALDPTSTGFAVLLGALLAAALAASAWWMERRRTAAQDALKVGGAAQSAPRELRVLRTALSVMQVTLTAALLFASGLLISSAQRALHADLGFDREQLLMTGISLEGPPDQVAFDALVTRFADRIQALPRTHEMTRGSCNPLALRRGPIRYQPPGSQDADMSHWPMTTFCPETAANFFAVLHMPVMQGRPFNEQEAREYAPVAIVDTDFVRKNFPDGHALGHVVRINAITDTDADPDGNPTAITTLTIVGVVPSVTIPGAQRLAPGIIPPFLYTPGWQGEELLLRTPGGLGAWTNDLKKLVHGLLSPRAMLGSTSFAKEVIADQVEGLYPANNLLSLLAAVTLALAALGLYAVLAYSTQMRQKEFAIRLALGESPARLRRSVVLEGLKWSGLGLLLAIPLIWLAGGVLKSQLYRVEPFDPLTLCAVIIVVALATLAATWLPARRAARTDPMQALRAE